MPSSTWTLNVATGAGGFVSRNLRDHLPAGELSITSIAFNVTCLVDGASTPVCQVTASGGAHSEAAPVDGGFVLGGGSWAFSITAATDGPGASAVLGAVDWSTFVGFWVADGAETATWTMSPPLVVPAEHEDLWVGILAFDTAEVGDSSYRLNSVTVVYSVDGPEPEPEPEPPLAVQVDVYESDNSTLVCSLTRNEAVPADARQVRELSGRVSLDDAGSGEVAVDFDHPQVNELTGGRFVRCTEGGRVRFAFSIDDIHDVRIPPPGSGQAGQVVTVSGEGPRSVLRRARVRPWLGFGLKPVSRRRRFDWSSPQLDTSDWTEPFDQFRLTSEPGKPFGLPSLFNTKWMWGEAEADSMTIGDCCFRRTFTIGGSEPVQVSAFASADDGFEDAWHGVKVVEANETFPGKVWHRPYRSPVTLDPGTYVYAAKARNDGGKGAFICDAWSVGAAGLIDQVFMTGLPEDNEYDDLYGTWLAFMNPAGEWFTPGEIVRILVEESIARDEIPDVTLDFSDTLDSAGNPWPKIEFECDATGTVDDAVELLEATHVDVHMSHDGLQLSMWNKDPGRGTASAVSVQHAAREIASDATTTDHLIVNDVLLVSDTAMTLIEDTASITTYGRRPGGSVQVGSITDQATLDQIGAAFLDGRTEPVESRVVEVTPLVDFDADCGDTVTVEADVLRVVEIGFELDDDGSLRKAPVLETAHQQRLKRGERMVERLIEQFGDSRAASKALDTGRTGVEAGAVTPVEMESWSWRDAEELDPGYWDVAETEVKAWQPYTAKEAARLVALIVKADWAEPDGAGGLDQVTTGESEFLLMRNGEATSPPFIATLPATNLDDPADPTTYGIAFILGEGYADPNSTWSVACITNGGHVNGAATIWAVDPT